MSITWPNVRRSIFAMHGEKLDTNTKCYVDHLRIYSFGESYLADEYKRAADTIVDTLARGTQLIQPDGQFMPVAYLYKHAIELKLKSLLRLIYECNIFDKNELSIYSFNQLMKSHKIIIIWSEIKPKLKSQFPKEPIKPINNVEALITELHKIDKTGQSLRYSKTLDGNDVLDKFPEVVCLKMFQQAITEIYSFIDVSYGLFGDWHSHISDPNNY